MKSGFEVPETICGRAHNSNSFPHFHISHTFSLQIVPQQFPKMSAPFCINPKIPQIRVDNQIKLYKLKTQKYNAIIKHYDLFNSFGLGNGNLGEIVRRKCLFIDTIDFTVR